MAAMVDENSAPQSNRRLDSAEPAALKVDRRLLEILVCPITKGALEYNMERSELVSRDAGLIYPVRDGIPIMIPEEAKPLMDSGRTKT